MTPTNQAAWLDDAGKPLRIGPADFPTAGEGELVIRNKALAVNPFSCMFTLKHEALRGLRLIIVCTVILTPYRQNPEDRLPRDELALYT